VRDLAVIAAMVSVDDSLVRTCPLHAGSTAGINPSTPSPHCRKFAVYQATAL